MHKKKMNRFNVVVISFVISLSNATAQGDCKVEDDPSGIVMHCFNSLSNIDNYIVKNNCGLDFNLPDSLEIFEIDSTNLTFVISVISDLELAHPVNDYVFQLVPFYYNNVHYLTLIGAEKNDNNNLASCERLNYVLGGDYYFILTINLDLKSIVKLMD